MNFKDSQTQTSCFLRQALKGLSLLASILILGSFAKTEAQRKQSISTTISFVCSTGRVASYDEFATVHVKINGQPIRGPLESVPSGAGELEVSTHPPPGEGRRWVVKEITLDGKPGEKPLAPNTAQANVPITIPYRGPGAAVPKLEITVDQCGGPTSSDDKGKDISVAVYSHDCKSPPDWYGLDVKVDGEVFFDAGSAPDLGEGGKGKYGGLRKISPGKHKFSVSSKYFPATTIEEAEVYKSYRNPRTKDLERIKGVGKYPMDASGEVTVTLDESLWEKDPSFSGLSLSMSVLGNCKEPKTDPKEFGIFQVKAISGEVQAADPMMVLLSRKEGGSPFQKAKVDDYYRRGTIIQTGADGLIVLESEYEHTITIENSTEVKLDTLATVSGRRQLSPLMKKGKIKIERQSSNTSNAVETTIETNTATAQSKNTIYTVSYDETTRLTAVGVEEGQVEVFPKNEALQPVTLGANQQVQVSDTSISAVTPYRTTPTPARPGTPGGTPIPQGGAPIPLPTGPRSTPPSSGGIGGTWTAPTGDTIELIQNGNRITGRYRGILGEGQITGTFDGKNLSGTFRPDQSLIPLAVPFALTLLEDGKLVGRLDTPLGSSPLSLTRTKRDQ